MNPATLFTLGFLSCAVPMLILYVYERDRRSRAERVSVWAVSAIQGELDDANARACELESERAELFKENARLRRGAERERRWVN